MDQKNTHLLLVDVQDKLFENIHQKELLEANIALVLKAARLLNLSLSVCEQYPKGLGETIKPLKNIFSSQTPLYEKTTFSCMGDIELKKMFLSHPKSTHWVLMGIEAHICVLLTALELQKEGYPVTILGDCIASRTHELKKMALNEMAYSQLRVTSLETFLFSVLKDAKHPKFKDVSLLFKK